MSSIILVSKDKVKFEVKREVAMISPTLKAMLESSFIEQSGEIELAEFESTIVAAVIDYLNFNFKFKDEDLSKTEIPEFEVPAELSLELLLAADYLHI